LGLTDSSGASCMVAIPFTGNVMVNSAP
jgi:hypothetical protein